MKLSSVLLSLALLSLLGGCSRPGEDPDVPDAEPAGSSSADIGGHVVHFSALSTDNLPPDIARVYNIVRSKNRAMLNVSVIDKETEMPVHAAVSVRTVNLTGQLKNVVMREILEQEAIYYIGVTPVANRETLIFDISVSPEGVSDVSELRFTREFYAN